MMHAAFWLSAAFVLYVYAGYPVLLIVWARLTHRDGPAGRHDLPAERGLAHDGSWPGVSIVVASRNEADRLPARVANLLATDYPADRRQIIVVSDGSTDHTSTALAPFSSRIELVTIPPGGKAVALNAGVARARHEILVFADARQTFAPDALRALTAPFTDPQVGGVTGELLLGCETGPISAGQSSPPSSAEGVGLYWRYEKALRRLEARIDSTLGATGAIYALRRSLWRALPAGTILDDVLAPMRAVLEGSRIVFEERAQAFDSPPSDSSAEARRKIRTLAGNFQILALEPRLLVPILNRVWIQYVSHKVGRLLVPYALIAFLVSSVALAHERFLYAAALGGQVAFYLLAAYGGWLERRSGTPLVRPPSRAWLARRLQNEGKVADA